jgi:hypothetical protein
MYRKLVICGVSGLALITLVVSAQEPVPGPLPKQPTPSIELPYAAGQYTPAPFYSGPKEYGKEIELVQKSNELVKQLAKAEGENRDKIKAQLTDTLGQQFDARQKRHQKEIQTLEAQLKKLKDTVEKRQENRREIISRRFEQLVREAEGLGW